jgi:hypothetical protein
MYVLHTEEIGTDVFGKRPFVVYLWIITLDLDK